MAQPSELIKQFALTPAELEQLQQGGMAVRREALNLAGLQANEQEVLRSRPSGALLPWSLEAYGRYNLLFLLDFGSYRDLQRHRNGVCPVPVLDARFGMDPWYLEQLKALLSPTDYAALQGDIAVQLAAVAALPAQITDSSPELSSYLLPMGLRALVHVAYSVPQMAYVGELRSGKTVHGSLRPVAQKMLRLLQQDLPGIAVHGDFDQDDWSEKRGEQTIAEKQSA